jgi:hypothetical protein
VTRRHASALAALVLGLAFAGCGEKSEPATTGPVVQTDTTTTIQPGTGDEDLVRAAASNFFIVPGPSVCDKGITPKLLKAEYGGRNGCIADRKPAKVATNADLGPVRLGNGTATLPADVKGGAYGKGQKVTLTVVRDGAGAWLVDVVKSSGPAGN